MTTSTIGTFLQRVKAGLNTAKARNALLGAHLVLLIGAFFLGHTEAPDQATYYALADGLAQGSYSVWNGILDPAPVDLLRTHGYPVFLMLVRSISKNPTLLFACQSILHVLTILLLLRFIAPGPEGHLRQSLFLLLLLPQFQLVYYAHQVFPETLMATLGVSFVLLITDPIRSIPRTVLLGLLAAAIFWVRPVMLFFPLFILLLDLVFVAGSLRWPLLRRNAAMMAIALLLGPLAFGWWNLRAHGVFKPIPLSGSSVNSNLGIWQLRLPGYGTMHYFQYNYFGREVLPLVNDDEAAAFYAAYEDQWERIETEAARSMTEVDVRNMPVMAEHRTELYATRSPAYTMALDDVIGKENKQMIQDEPLYYLGTRLYAGVRLWVTNINLPMDKVVYEPTPGVRPKVGRPNGLSGWASALVPFLITFFTFGIGIPLLLGSVIGSLRGRTGRWAPWRYALYMIGYVWVVHVPMSIQSRYTVPVHALAIACIALLLAGAMSRKVERAV